MTRPERRPFDLAAYAERSRRGPCFICASLAGDPAYPHHEVYADDPTPRGYTLVAPLKRVLPVERVHLLSLGSHQGNAHGVPATPVSCQRPSQRSAAVDAVPESEGTRLG